MFIYHFSRLIKSKLLWGFLALLMVFAFVVADSCSGPSMDRSAGILNGETVDGRLLGEAETTTMFLNRVPFYFMPGNAQLFARILQRQTQEDEELESAAHERQLWELMAIYAAAERNGLVASQKGAQEVLRRMFADENGNFSVNHYAYFLNMLQVGDPRIFEEVFAKAWLPAQEMTQTVYNSVGWVSPMERAFDLAMQYDSTTAVAVTLKSELKADAMEVSDAELNAWYEAHKDEYEVPEERVITYVEIPTTAFIEKATVTDDDAMLYYEDHPEEFYGTGTNATVTLPFAEVKDKALAKAKDVQGLTDASTYAKTELIPQVQEKGLEALKEAYGEAKTATVRLDRPFGFQNARTLIETVFEMDPEYVPHNVIDGTDRVYVICLQKVVEKHIATFDEVKTRVQNETRQDRLATKLKEEGAAVREKLLAELNAGTAIDQAVAKLQMPTLTAEKPATFVLADNPTLDIAHAADVLKAAETLATKTLSEPIIAGNDVLFVYITDRTPGDMIVKATNALTVARQGSAMEAFSITRDWVKWNLDRDPPTDLEGTPLLTGPSEE